MDIFLTAEQLDAVNKALEAQHRKTWALAMETSAGKVNNAFNGVITGLQAIIAETPCPPIEETKGE